MSQKYKDYDYVVCFFQKEVKTNRLITVSNHKNSFFIYNEKDRLLNCKDQVKYQDYNNYEPLSPLA